MTHYPHHAGMPDDEFGIAPHTDTSFLTLLAPDCFLATAHRALNRSGGERYALAFFCDSNIDWPAAAVPTRLGPDNPAGVPHHLLHPLHGLV
jgi:isopenicillin N synthase-like dioxygenase